VHVSNEQLRDSARTHRAVLCLQGLREDGDMSFDAHPSQITSNEATETFSDIFSLNNVSINDLDIPQRVVVKGHAAERIAMNNTITQYLLDGTNL
jgi:hypothetical protein